MKKIDFILSIVSGVLMAIANPEYGLSLLAWIALVPLFFALKNKNFKQSFLIGLLAGIAEFAAILRWLPSSAFRVSDGSYIFIIIAWIVIVVYPALIFGLFSVAYCFFKKYFIDNGKNIWWKIAGILVIPASFVALEFLQLKIWKGFPWVFDFFGRSQWNSPHIIQIAFFSSMSGVSFLLVLASLCIYRFIENRKAKEVLVGVIIFAICFFYGVWIIDFKAPKIEQDQNDSIKVSILDGNIDSQLKWQDKQKTGDYIAQTYLNLTSEATKENPDLIVWTETAIPWPMEEGDDLIETALTISSPIKAYHIIGMPSYAENNKFLNNSVFFINPDGVATGEYDKVNILDFIENKNSGISGLIKIGNSNSSYIKGKDRELPETPFGKIGTLICNETIYQDYARRVANKGAQIMISMANDNLLANNEKVLEKLFSVNVFRAIENRRDFIVSINSGVSGSIDAYGRVTKMSYEKGQSHVVTTTVKARNEKTFYGKYGDVFSYFCIIFTVLSVVFIFYLKKYNSYGK